MKKMLSIIDERELAIFRKVCTSLYILTILALLGIVSYRQFVLHQPQREWDDIAIVLSMNVIVALGVFLFRTGTLNPARIRIRYLAGGYAGFVVLGFAFTLFKYAVLENLDVDLAFAFDKLKTILLISGLLVLAWGLSAYLGHRRLEDRME